MFETTGVAYLVERPGERDVRGVIAESMERANARLVNTLIETNEGRRPVLMQYLLTGEKHAIYVARWKDVAHPVVAPYLAHEFWSVVVAEEFLEPAVEGASPPGTTRSAGSHAGDVLGRLKRYVASGNTGMNPENLKRRQDARDIARLYFEEAKLFVEETGVTKLEAIGAELERIFGASFDARRVSRLFKNCAPEGWLEAKRDRGVARRNGLRR